MTDDEIYRRDSEIINLRAALAEARGSSVLNGALCDLGFASLDIWREETIRLRAALAESEDERKAYISRELYVTKARDKAEADLAAAREVIAPFAKCAELIECTTTHECRDGDEWEIGDLDHILKLGDLRRARAFLERTATVAAHSEQRK